MRFAPAVLAAVLVLASCGSSGPKSLDALWHGSGEQVSMVIDDVGQWLGSLTAVGNYFPTIKEVVVSVFRALAVSGGYAFDVVKAGAGAVATIVYVPGSSDRNR